MAVTSICHRPQYATDLHMAVTSICQQLLYGSNVLKGTTDIIVLLTKYVIDFNTNGGMQLAIELKK
ncbi:hypothetical protein L211DRAFT_836358 [Terfezia boudieri ATCC MYA-4762]|uniref:Uncharacterized protein n=1 Tax=Terfezia boudieri ATCC MYA-4762 TaxID=1051890 RepID=A0A3N4LRT1_9PEZI|nr:hypothetical protein L211DRAFT_836358 [Terfezia boudieri ATCC MYA-4762]